MRGPDPSAAECAPLGDTSEVGDCQGEAQADGLLTEETADLSGGGDALHQADEQQNIQVDALHSSCSAEKGLQCHASCPSQGQGQPAVFPGLAVASSLDTTVPMRGLRQEVAADLLRPVELRSYPIELDERD